jgi:hypothetical protein
MSINDFEERISALKAKGEEISLKFAEELKNESKNISTKRQSLLGGVRDGGSGATTD